MGSSAALGIDIGGTSVKAALVQDGAVLWTGQSPSYAMPDRSQLMAAIRQALQGPIAPATAVGLCVPGVCDVPRRTITLAVNVPGLMNIVLDDLVHQALPETTGGAVHMLNDAGAAAYDIYRTRQLRGRLLALVLGTGVGAAVLDDGQPIQLTGLEPGHVGQLDVGLDDKPPIGPDGGAGGLEGYFGVAALTARYGSTGAALESMRITDPPLRALVRAMRICHAIFVPDHIVLAGGLGIRMERFLAPLQEAVNTHLTSVANPAWTLGIADSDFHAATGAARWAADR